VKLIKGNMDLISICSIHLKFKDEVYFIHVLNMIFFFFVDNLPRLWICSSQQTLQGTALGENI